MIQSAMLVALGFLAATLISVFIAPAFYARAVRLTTQRIKRSLPVSEFEIRADKDRLRAQYAVQVHQLERQVQDAKLAAARQLIELNRRDARITVFERKGTVVQADLEENQNARRVLEQTINERLPKLEGRLDEARRLLQARDRAIVELTNEAKILESALDQARGLTARLEDENARMRAAMAARQDRDRRQFAEPADESEFALRSELATLRAQARENVSLVDRLRRDLATSNASQRGAIRPAGSIKPAAALVVAASAKGNGHMRDVQAMESQVAEQQQRIEQLTTALGESEAQISRAAAEAANGDQGAVNRIKELSDQMADRDQTIERLGADLTALEAEKAAFLAKDGRESKAALRGQIEAIQKRLEHEATKVARLRAELTAANERAARQTAQMMDEMRRVGSVPLRAKAAAAVDERRIAGGRRFSALADGAIAARLTRSADTIGGSHDQPSALVPAPATPTNGSNGEGDSAKPADGPQGNVASLREGNGPAAAPGNGNAARGREIPALVPATLTPKRRKTEVGTTGRSRARLLERLRSYD